MAAPRNRLATAASKLPTAIERRRFDQTIRLNRYDPAARPVLLLARLVHVD
jgi:hypothetical protein